VKGKVNQSMALGVPVVVTSIAAEGMYLEHEENALIADDPESFAAAVVRLWRSEELWERLSHGGRVNVEEHFSVEAASRRIDDLLAWAGLSRPENRGRSRERSGSDRPGSRCPDLDPAHSSGRQVNRVRRPS
jgi:hypothetical protein